MTKNDPDHFNLLRKIQNKPGQVQRELAKDLGFSLGKLNYCMRSLKEKGLIKIKNFKNNKSKINYLYVITPKGITQKTKMTISFMKLKMKEFDELKTEYEKEKK
jgi:EPS-associated MarR family transcriptional regulator